MKYKIILFFVCLIGITIFLVKVHDSSSKIDYVAVKDTNIQKTPEDYIKENLAAGDRAVTVNKPVPLSGLTKQEVYNIRKKYVKDSLFYYPGYEPSEGVFGQIEDGKPWISVNRCAVNESRVANTEGASEETTDINNPSALITIDWPYLLPSLDFDLLCNSVILPKQINYIKKDNLIVVKYNFLPFFKKIFFGAPYELKGINALDFGYRYVYLDSSKSKNLVDFQQSSNVSNQVVELLNFIHTGGSCKVEGGCNNASPYQPLLNFYYKDPGETVELYLKLWHEKPQSPDMQADINEKIIIQGYPYLKPLFKKIPDFHKLGE